MACFKGFINGMSSGYGVTQLPLIKRPSLGIGDRQLNNVVIPETIDGRLQTCRDDAEIELYTGRFILNRMAMAARVDGQTVRMGFFTFLVIHFILIPLAAVGIFLGWVMGGFFAGLDATTWANQLTWALMIGLPVIAVLRILANTRAWLKLG